MKKNELERFDEKCREQIVKSVIKRYAWGFFNFWKIEYTDEELNSFAKFLFNKGYVVYNDYDFLSSYNLYAEWKKT